MITVHHLGISQSDRVVWLCEELGLDYTLRIHDRDATTRMAPETYRALHPLGTAPIAEIDGQVLAETGAIVDHIIATHGAGRLRSGPADAGFADFLLWYHFANASLMPAMMAQMAPDTPMAAMMRERLGRYLDTLESTLADGRAWLAGDDFTAADIMMMFPLVTMRAFVPLDLTGRPHTIAYLARIEERPAYKAMREKADPGLVIPPAG